MLYKMGQSAVGKRRGTQLLPCVWLFERCVGKLLNFLLEWTLWVAAPLAWLSLLCPEPSLQGSRSMPAWLCCGHPRQDRPHVGKCLGHPPLQSARRGCFKLMKINSTILLSRCIMRQNLRESLGVNKLRMSCKETLESLDTLISSGAFLRAL